MNRAESISLIAKAFDVPPRLLGVGSPPYKRSKHMYPHRRKFRAAMPSRNHWSDWLLTTDECRTPVIPSP